ncbi:MAG: sugar phosphate isomerase/epimerase [Lachnospiraceae bacterium]|jgi:sugar phosphate isomerase/epimerase|nr:sugar phosphate isomerase/epimerase [Lachnospiraceae bacterium]
MKLACFYDNLLEAAKQENKDITDILQQVREMGITSVECSIEALLEDEVKMKVMLAEADLTVSAVYGKLDFGTAPDASYGYSLVDTAVSFGCKKVLVIPGFSTSAGDPYIVSREVGTPVMQQMAKNLKELLTYARSRGVLLMMEDYDDITAPFCSEVQLRWFIDNVPGLFVCFDTGNFMYAGVSEVTAFGLLKDHIVHVHLKDRDIAGDPDEEPKIAIDGTPLYASPVGYGMIAMNEILRGLVDIGYDDVLAIEHFGAPDQMRYLKASVDWVNMTWAEENAGSEE